MIFNKKEVQTEEIYVYFNEEDIISAILDQCNISCDISDPNVKYKMNITRKDTGVDGYKYEGKLDISIIKGGE